MFNFNVMHLFINLKHFGISFRFETKIDCGTKTEAYGYPLDNRYPCNPPTAVFVNFGNKKLRLAKFFVKNKQITKKWLQEKL